MNTSFAASDESNAGKILTSTLWNQNGTIYVQINGTQTALSGYKYNQYCPNASSTVSSKTLTGCTNTADSQVFYYWIEKKGYKNLSFTLTGSDYFYLSADPTKVYYVSNTSNVGEGTISAMNSLLASTDRVGNGDFIAALNFYCGAKNHATYGTSATSTTWWYGAYTDGTNAWAFKAAGFDSYYFISRSGTAAVSKLFFGKKGLTDVGYSILRENLDYGEVIRVGVPGHAIYMDGYRKTSSGYEYHLNYGWGVNATDYTRWYTVSELSTTDSTNLYGYITYVMIDLSPDITVKVTSARGDYYGGSFLRGIERINHIQNTKSTTFTFADSLAGKTITMSTTSTISSKVNVAFQNVNAVLTTTASGLIASGRGMSFELNDGGMAVNSKSASFVVKGTGSSAVKLTLDSSYIYSGYHASGVSSLVSLLNGGSGYSYGEYSSSFYASVKGNAVSAGSGADSITLTNGSAIYGGLNLGAGKNVLNIENGSLFYGSFTGAAKTLTANLTVGSAAFNGPMIVVKDSQSTQALYSATGGVLNVKIELGAMLPMYILAEGVSADIMKKFSARVTSPIYGSKTLNYKNSQFGKYILRYNGGQMALVQKGNGKKNKVNLYYGNYLLDGLASMNSVFVCSGLRMDVLSGGVVSTVTVNGTGLIDVYKGGKVTAASVEKGGRISLRSGGRLFNLTADAGSVITVASGGQIGGRLSLSGGASVDVARGGSVVMDLSMPVSNVYITNIHRITGAPNFVVKVNEAGLSAEGKSSTYRLATGAKGFQSSISVQTSQAKKVGNLSVNTTLRASGMVCSLNTSSDGVLLLKAARTQASSSIQHDGSVGRNGFQTETLLLKPDYSGRYTLRGSFGRLNGTITVYNGKKVVGKASVKNGSFLFNGGRTILLDNTVQYSVVVQNKAPGKGAANFDYTLQGVSIFWKATHEKDSWNASPAITVNRKGMEISSGWTGFSDPVDYQKFVLKSASRLSLKVKANDTVRVTLYDASRKAIQTTVHKAYGVPCISVTGSKLLTAGSYYLCIESKNAASGRGADYSVTVNENSRFFTKADHSNDTIQKAAKQTAVLPGEAVSGWVGFGDAVDYIRMELNKSGKIKLDLDDATRRAYQKKQIRLTCLDASGKAVSLASYDRDTLITRKSVSAGTYFLGVACSNVRKYDTSYKVTTGFLAG